MTTVIALVVSLGSFALSLYLFFTGRWASRKASIEVRYEEMRRPNLFANGITDSEDVRRLVLINHGPHDAKDVHVTVFRIDGVETAPIERRIVPLDDDTDGEARPREFPGPLPVPVLHAGQTYHVPFTTGVGNRPWSATITWSDGRHQIQSQGLWLGTTIV